MQYRVAYGDGGFSELQSAIRIHGNAVEYIPIAIVLDAVYGNEWRRNLMVHICGIVFACWSSDALLRFSSPSVPLATFRHERHLVCAVADGAGESLVYALGVGFPCVSAQYATFFFPDFYVMSHRDTLFLRPYRQTGRLTLMNG